MNCEIVERDLDAYVDRELEPAAAIEIREHVNTCVSCHRLIAQREALRGLLRTAPYYPAPDRLRAAVSARATRRAAVRPWVMWASAAVVIVAVATSLTVMRPGGASRDTIVNTVIDGHVRSMMAEHLFDVRSTDQHTVKPWFLGKLDFSPPVTDLASIGFPLVGGRLDYLDGKPVAALVYQRQKHVINVFVSPTADSGGSGIDSRANRGFHVRHWTRAGMSFWAVSDLNDSELTEFAEALRSS